MSWSYPPRGPRLPDQPTCPHCQRIVDGYTIVDGPETATPSEGDYTICMYCSQPSTYYQPVGARALKLRPLSERERREMPAELRMMLGRLELALRDFRAQRRARRN